MHGPIGYPSAWRKSLGNGSQHKEKEAQLLVACDKYMVNALPTGQNDLRINQIRID